MWALMSRNNTNYALEEAGCQEGKATMRSGMGYKSGRKSENVNGRITQKMGIEAVTD